MTSLADLANLALTGADARHLAATLTHPRTLLAAGRDVLDDPDAGWTVWKTVTDLYPASPEAWLLTQLAASLTGRWWWKPWAAIKIGERCHYRPLLTSRDLHRACTHHAPSQHLTATPAAR